jgi:hypothetical protein
VRERFRLHEENPPRRYFLHDMLCFLRDAAQIIFSAEAFRIDFVDTFRPGGTRSEPSVLRHDLQSSHRSAVAGRVGLDALDSLAGKICRLDLACGNVGQHFLLFQRGWGLSAVVDGLTEIARKLAVNFSGIAAGARSDLGR